MFLKLQLMPRGITSYDRSPEVAVEEVGKRLRLAAENSFECRLRNLANTDDDGCACPRRLHERHPAGVFVQLTRISR
jgi:hypothetical protein